MTGYVSVRCNDQYKTVFKPPRQGSAILTTHCQNFQKHFHKEDYNYVNSSEWDDGSSEQLVLSANRIYIIKHAKTCKTN